MKKTVLALTCAVLCAAPALAEEAKKPYRSTDDIIASAPADAWRSVDPANLLYMQLDKGTVIYELAPDFAPEHVAQIRMLAQKHFWDGLSIYRVQDNYVTQFGDPNVDTDKQKPLPAEAKKLPAEFERPLQGLNFTALPDPDGWSEKVGFADGFPVASEKDTAWIAHCYGILGAGRDNPPDSSNGTELYVVIGQSPRHLDRNITLVGRVLQGVELLSSLPRGGGNNSGYMGFYQDPKEYTPIKSIRLGSEVPENERVPLQVMKTDSQSFADVVESRRNRGGDWIVRPAGHTDVCNITVPVRRAP